MKKVVIIGGGHGQSIIVKGLKDINDIELTAIVTVADSGGSTGRLRELYDVLAVGDIRNVLTAMIDSNDITHKLLDYRFKGEGNSDVVGHNLGNLILFALMEIKGSLNEAIKLLSSIARVKGKILPSTLENVSLYARMDDDVIVKGEASIPSFIHHISDVFYDHEVVADEEAINAIKKADLIIYGVGSLYTSIAPNTIIKGIKEALNETKAKKVYFVNCMTQPNETFDYDLKDHVDALEKHGAKIDLIIYPNETIPDNILQKYSDSNSKPVTDNGNVCIPIIKRDLLDFSNDLVRHDPNKIKSVVEELLEEI